MDLALALASTIEFCHSVGRPRATVLSAAAGVRSFSATGSATPAQANGPGKSEEYYEPAPRNVYISEDPCCEDHRGLGNHGEE